MVIKESEFLKSAVKKRDYPKTTFPEIAFAGRSNVGKSSFINKFLNRKKLAKVSKTQGKTTLINFFLVNRAFLLVDLPGYGYANVSKEEKESWGNMIEDYLNEREQLKAVFLLLDIRHPPTEDDELMLSYILARGFTPVIILTKADKLAKTKIPIAVEEFKEYFQLQTVYPFSATSGYGREELLQVVATFL